MKDRRIDALLPLALELLKLIAPQLGRPEEQRALRAIINTGEAMLDDDGGNDPAGHGDDHQ